MRLGAQPHERGGRLGSAPPRTLDVIFINISSGDEGQAGTVPGSRVDDQAQARVGGRSIAPPRTLDLIFMGFSCDGLG